MSFRTRFSDGSPDLTSPHAPGFRFADVGARDDAEDAYRRRSRRMEDAWRGQPPRQDEHRDQREPQQTLDEARAAAAESYERRRQRLGDAWRNRADGAA